MAFGNPLVPDRIWARLRHTPDGCWEWTAHLNYKGYGKVSLHGACKSVHRVMYQLLVGPIPDGLDLDHLCRNRACGNPDHLEPVPKRTNILRGQGLAAKNARKTHCKHGHEFTTENTRITPIGHRECRTCAKAHARASHERHMARMAAGRTP
jgi:hypothetical protein